MKLSFDVLNAYSVRNAGDHAIVLATARLVREFHPNASVRVRTRHYREDANQYAEGGISVGRPLVWAPIRRAGEQRIAKYVRALGVPLTVLGAVLYAGWRRIMGRSMALESWLFGQPLGDRAVICGGGYLYSARDGVSLTLLIAVLNMMVAGALYDAVVMAPQSIGPLNRRLDRCLVRMALRRLHRGGTPLVVREAYSRDLVSDLYPSAQVHVVPDVAFLLEHEEVSLGIRQDVVVSVMDWTWAGSEAADLQLYLQRLSDVARCLQRQGLTVSVTGTSVMPEQSQDDFQIATRLADLVPGVRVIKDQTGAAPLHQLILTCLQSRLVLGTRLHSCIVSLAVGTPAICLAYQPKGQGTYEILSLGDSVYDVRAFDPSAVCGRIVQELRVGSDTFVRVDRVRGEILRAYASLGMSVEH